MENSIENAKQYINDLKNTGNYFLDYNSVAEMLFRYADKLYPSTDVNRTYCLQKKCKCLAKILVCGAPKSMECEYKKTNLDLT